MGCLISRAQCVGALGRGDAGALRAEGRGACGALRAVKGRAADDGGVRGAVFPLSHIEKLWP